MSKQYGWWELDTVHKYWTDGQFTVEPNESAAMPFQFIISADVEAVAIATAILKPRRNRNLVDNPSEIDWTCYNFLELPVIPQRREPEGP